MFCFCCLWRARHREVWGIYYGITLKTQTQTEQRIKKVDISLAMEEATKKNTFMRTDFLSDASN